MADMEIRNTIKTQLNEKVSETQYDVLHPETHADVVITTTNKQFVSQEEKDKWDSFADQVDEKGLLYQGTWSSIQDYHINDVVSYKGRFYICIKDNKGSTPSEEANTAQ